MIHYLTINDAESGKQLIEFKSSFRLQVGDRVWMDDGEIEVGAETEVFKRYYHRGMVGIVVGVDVFVNNKHIRQLVEIAPKP
jgi:hypothetical protein